MNTKSSTESELVGASYLAFTKYTTFFLGMQGNTIENNIYFQDNESMIHFETNRTNSCGSKSRHVNNIRYFWGIKNRLESENIKVKHCPTLQMLADFFKKLGALQGSIEHVDTLRQELKSLPQSRSMLEKTMIRILLHSLEVMRMDRRHCQPRRIKWHTLTGMLMNKKKVRF